MLFILLSALQYRVLWHKIQLTQLTWVLGVLSKLNTYYFQNDSHSALGSWFLVTWLYYDFPLLSTVQFNIYQVLQGTLKY